jgi:hypothetical protein
MARDVYHVYLRFILRGGSGVKGSGMGDAVAAPVGASANEYTRKKRKIDLDCRFSIRGSSEQERRGKNGAQRNGMGDAEHHPCGTSEGSGA